MKLSSEKLKQITAMPLVRYVEAVIADEVPPQIPFGDHKNLEKIHWVYVLSTFLAERVDEVVSKVEEFQKKHPRDQFQIKIEVAKK